MGEAVLTTGERLTVGKIVCVGKNYEAHAREMGAAAAPAEPVLFMKPSTAIVADGGKLVIPPGVGAVHHEGEIAVLIGERASRVPEAIALRHVAGYGLCIDATARDLQAAAKKSGNPWFMSKGMDTFAPLGAFVPASRVGDWRALEFELLVNGEVRQQGRASDMVHGLPALVAYVSRFVTLERGDVLMTGTPAGVGPMVPGDRVEVRAAVGAPALPPLHVSVVHGE